MVEKKAVNFSLPIAVAAEYQTLTKQLGLHGKQKWVIPTSSMLMFFGSSEKRRKFYISRIASLITESDVDLAMAAVKANTFEPTPEPTAPPTTRILPLPDVLRVVLDLETEDLRKVRDEADRELEKRQRPLKRAAKKMPKPRGPGRPDYSTDADRPKK